MTTLSASLPNALPPLTTLQTPASGSPAASADPSRFDAEARAKAEEFEANFLSALLRPVFEGLAKDSTFGGGFAEETWSGLLTDEYARSIASSNSLGIADQVYRQIISVQEAAQDGTAAISSGRQPYSN
ncbi:MAG: rod-binding protein [Pseudomonadota bacterium]